MTSLGYDADLDVAAEAQRLLLALRVLDGVRLDQLGAVCRAAHTLGPIIDPTRYSEQVERGDMDRMARLAELALPAQRYFREEVRPILDADAPPMDERPVCGVGDPQGLRLTCLLASGHDGPHRGRFPSSGRELKWLDER